MKKPVVLWAVATLLATLAVAYVWAQLSAARARGAELSARVTALESAPQPVPTPAVATAQPQSAEVSAAKPAIDVSPAASARVIATPAPAAAEPEPAPLMQAMLQAMQASGVMDEERGMMRTMMGEAYPNLASELGLSADEANRFLDLLASQGAGSMEDAMAMMEGGPPDSAARAAVLRRTEERERAQEAQQAAMLGSKYTKWQNYQHLVAARNEIRQLTTLLATGENPLTDAQAKELLPVLTAEQRRIAQQERDWTKSRAAVQAPNLMQAYTTRMLEVQQREIDVVAKHLTTAQAEQYRRKKEQDLAMTRAMMGMFGGSGAPSPGTPGRTQP